MGVNNLRISDAGIKLICKFEGCRLTAYRLKGEQYYTIGYGHSFDPNIKAGTVITQAQAEAYLRQDLAKFEKTVNNLVPFKLTQSAFDALVSYTYNRGAGGLKQLLNNSKGFTQVGNNMTVYWGSATAYKNGLINRRTKEQAHYFKDGSPNATQPKLTSEQVADMIISGNNKWGNGADRKKNLLADGYDYNAVQAIINQKLNVKPAPAVKPKRTHIVQKGENLSRIGKAEGVNWQTIASLNGIKAPYVIYPGQVLKLN